MVGALVSPVAAALSDADGKEDCSVPKIYSILNMVPYRFGSAVLSIKIRAQILLTIKWKEGVMAIELLHLAQSVSCDLNVSLNSIAALWCRIDKRLVAKCID